MFFNYSNVEKKAFHNYRAIQRDNDIFSKQYTNVQKQKERYNSPEKQFAEIKEQYDKKGYKVPSLSLDHNIFNQNLLLLDESDIEKYILFNHGSAKNQEKSMKYLDKLNEDMLTMQISGNNPDILGALNQKRHNQQMQEKMEEEKKKVNTGIGYKNRKYRPSVFFDKSMQIDIEMHFKEKGYKSFNEYVNALVIDDMSKEK